ncbi:hypothetical protein PR202_ga27762 [Eleusine coracana subsp. coracana]|uniref:Uncharacterized protein n=1 Tax=Eleusine coracana subsp. coracana TaxID=191504 RepID=A0AAV5DHP3_ELECO|nr:hypothetical protein PR202_ga27762 [Eleusine coracana subsp. coracana]
MAWALQIRWQWFKKTRTDRPWTDLELPSHPNSLALFALAVTTQVGNGANTLFWSDRWIHGQSIQSLAPMVFERVPARIRNKRTVAEAFIDDSWTQDVQGSLLMEGTIQLFRLWDCLMNIDLNDNDDQHVWRLDASGCYSAKSAYKAYFRGAITFEPWTRVWKSWAPPKCKMFFMVDHQK